MMHFSLLYKNDLFDYRSVEKIYKKWRDQLCLRDNKYNGTLMHWAVNREVCVCVCVCVCACSERERERFKIVNG